MANLANLGRVDVNVNHLCAGREALHISGDSVVKTSTERNQQIGFLKARHGRHGAVHSGHPEVLTVSVRKCAARHQGGGNRGTNELGQL